MMAAEDRLGDALREIALGMVAHNKPCIRMQVLIGDVEATYEVRLIKVRKKMKVSVRPRSNPR